MTNFPIALFGNGDFLCYNFKNIPKYLEVLK